MECLSAITGIRIQIAIGSVRLKGIALGHLASIHQNGRTVPSSGTKICGKRLVAEPSATARDQKPVDDLHPNGVMRRSRVANAANSCPN
jgi:hypothetical protein